MDEDTLQRLRKAYRVWSDSKGQSIDAWMELIGDEIEFGSLANGAPGVEFAGKCGCPDDVRSYLTQLASEWDMIESDFERFIADDDTVVALGSCTWRCKRTGKSVATPKADVWRFRNGKACGYFEFYDTARIIAATQP